MMKQGYSLSQRLFLAGALLLILFLGSAGWALNQVFERWVTTAVKEQALGHIYAILAAAEEDWQGLPVFNDDLPDPRLLTPDSGIYAQVNNKVKNNSWQSPSMLGQQFVQPPKADAGQIREFKAGGLFYLSYGIEWEDLNGDVHPYQIVVMLDLEPYQQEAGSFRRQLWFWLGGSGVFLLLIQLVLLRWALKPINVVTGQIKQIQNGEQKQLTGEFPRELYTFKHSLNQLIEHNQRVTERYRNKLGDLAHSLKTPLAVLQNAHEGGSREELAASAQEQLPRIREILEYQLGKAAVVGQSGVLEAIAISPVVEKILGALQKVYYDKNMQVETDLDASSRFQIDPGDLMELVGNTLDNAFKYGNNALSVKVKATVKALEIQVEDDGDGIAQQQIDQVLQRGVRLDENTEQGQGIGLSIVKEIVRAYDGELLINPSDLGGTKILVRLRL